ncbi:MAG: CBS domain-containing protein [Natronomonas sp.]
MNVHTTPVKEEMTETLEIIDPRATVSEAAAEMQDRDISALLVTAAAPGLVTKADVLDAVAAGRDPTETPVEAIMTEPVESVPPDCSLGEAAAMMTTFGVEHLPVADDDFLGMVSMADITTEIS